MNKLRLNLFIGAALLISGALCSTAQAQNRVFVSGVGDDLNPCTRTSPCRNFQRGHDAVVAGGEVVALDSGGFGSIAITKSVTITGDGVYAGITAQTALSSAITVSAANTDTVVLRGLTLVGLGGQTGINATSVGSLHVEGCVISGFTGNGINVNLAANGSRILIKDTITRNNDSGIVITTTTGTVRASIDNCHSDRNGSDGFVADFNSRVTINRSVASGNGGYGFVAGSVVSGTTAELSCQECVSSGNSIGFNVSADPGSSATIRVSRSTATNNFGNGFRQLPGGVFKSLGNNLVDGNTTGSSFGTITALTAL